MKLPLSITVSPSDEDIMEWSKENETLLHKASVHAIINIAMNPELDEAVIFNFYEKGDHVPFAEITVLREDAVESLHLAEQYFVSQEMYEEAAWVKNSHNLFEYKQHE